MKQIENMASGVVKLGITIGIGLIVLGEFADNLSPGCTGNSSLCGVTAGNLTAIQGKLGTIVSWIGIIIVIIVAVYVLNLYKKGGEM